MVWVRKNDIYFFYLVLPFELALTLTYFIWFTPTLVLFVRVFGIGRRSKLIFRPSARWQNIWLSLTLSLSRSPYFAHFINSITLPFQSNKPQSTYTNWICWMCNSKRARNVFASQIENIKSIDTRSQRQTLRRELKVLKCRQSTHRSNWEERRWWGGEKRERTFFNRRGKNAANAFDLIYVERFFRTHANHFNSIVRPINTQIR